MKKGYTLIELILVVSALILIASFGIARYNEFNDRQSVQQAADSFISNLRLVQAKALSGDKPSGCTTLVGWTVEFGLKSYTMYAECKPEGIIDSTRLTVDLPGNVNLDYPSPSMTYYALGRGTSASQTVGVVGKKVTVPVVLSASSITKEAPTTTTIAVATPTPMPVACPWPAGDPRCGDLVPSTPTPTFESQSAQFACQAAGGTWQSYPPFSCQDACFLVGLGGEPGSCEEGTGFGCNCGDTKCWDGGTCVPNPTPTPFATLFPTPFPTHFSTPTPTPNCIPYSCTCVVESGFCLGANKSYYPAPLSCGGLSGMCCTQDSPLECSQPYWSCANTCEYPVTSGGQYTNRTECLKNCPK